MAACSTPSGTRALPTPFFTLTNTDTAGERGLLGLALDPGFPTSPWVYTYQTYDDAANGTVYNRIVRIRASGDVGISHSVILQMPPLTGGIVHNGGVIAFGPDGKLYAVVGENAQASLAQNPMSVFGKVLRMNPDGSPPSDNPFYGSFSWENLVYTYGVPPGHGPRVYH
jgi:glucose/arabinose dehydrogenase